MKIILVVIIAILIIAIVTVIAIGATGGFCKEATPKPTPTATPTPTPTPTPIPTPTATPTPTPTPTPTSAHAEEEEEQGCFIATAAYSTSTAEEIDVLRAFRDEVLLESTLGSQLVEWYYQTSPPVADFISEQEGLRTLVRELLVDPVVWVVEAMEAMWRD